MENHIQHVEKVTINDTPANKKQVETWSLVLLSANINHSLVNVGAGWFIFVEKKIYDYAKFQLDQFERENLNWPPPERKEKTGRSSWNYIFVGVLAVALGSFFQVTGEWSARGKWFTQGAVSNYQIFGNGEWWRVVTGLTLHADINHLVGNLVFGGLMLAYLSLQIGFGAAFFFALLTGAAGNFVNTYYHGGVHNSVGFSTAVFGVLGVLCGLRFNKKHSGLKDVLLPLGAGMGLLAMLGGDGERTDLGAHLWGLFIGAGVGAAIQKVKIFWLWRPYTYFQAGLVIITLAITYFSWQAALS